MKRAVARPFVRWNGGKTYRLKEIRTLLEEFPCHEYHYIEPMVGGGAIFFDLAHRFKKATIGDVNPELFNLYRVNQRQVHELLSELHNGEYLYRGYSGQDSKANYHRIRAWELEEEAVVQRAARYYFLN